MIWSIIEGNIGSGKTWNMRHNPTFKDYIICEQPVHEWDLLKPYYHDRKTYALALQKQILASYAKIMKSYEGQDVHLLIESGHLGSRYIFCPLLFHEGYLDKQEVDEFMACIPEFQGGPQKIYLLSTDPDQCLINIRQRGRPGEENITKAYLESLDSNIKGEYTNKYKNIISYI